MKLESGVEINTGITPHERSGGNEMTYLHIKRLSLKLFIAFLVLTALVGIVSVLSGEFGELQIKILVTCLTISAASICSMACAAFIEKRKHKALGLAGISLCIASALLAIFGMWSEIDNEEYWKATLTVGVVALALVHTFLLMLPELDGRHTWVQTVASVCIGILALQLVVAAWGEIEDETYYRGVAVVAIVVGLETLVIPILMRFRQGNGQPIKRLVLSSVEGDLYEDASGRRYRVTDVRERENSLGPRRRSAAQSSLDMQSALTKTEIPMVKTTNTPV